MLLLDAAGISIFVGLIAVVCVAVIVPLVVIAIVVLIKRKR